MKEYLKSELQTYRNLLKFNVSLNNLNFLKNYGFPALFSLLFVFISYRKIRFQVPSLTDFSGAYYPAGRLIFENPDHLYKLSNVDIFGFVNLPIIAYLFTPLSFINLSLSKLVFTTLGAICIVFSLYLIITYFKIVGWRRTVLFSLLIINTPFYNSLWFGNTTHMMLLPLVCSLLCFCGRKDFLGGVLLALAGLIKLPLLFLMLFFVIRQRWRALLGSCLTLLGAVSLSVVLCGWDLNLIWFQRCILSFSGKVVGAYNVQSVDSFLVRLLTAAPLDSWDMYEASWQLKLARYSLFLLFIGGTFWALFRAKHSTTPEAESLEFSIFLCLAIISSPISWTHYYLLLLLPISLLISLPWMTLKRWTWSATIAVVILLISTPPVKNVSASNPFVAAFMRNFLVSHYFWGGVLLLGILLVARWKAPQMLLEQQSHEG